MMSRFKRDDRGAAMVEFAIVLPVLMLILLGIIEFGRAYNAQVSIQAAAHEGARELALRHSSTDVVERDPRRRPLGDDRQHRPDPLPGVGRRQGEGDDHRVVLVHGPAVRTARPHGHRSHAMRSLIRSRIRRDDAGATIVIVALMMVVLLGMGALVIDVGQLYAERRELQNGADAAALAVAQDCAGGDCRDETTTAGTYADDNAHDGKAAVDEVCGSGPGLTPCATPAGGCPRQRLGQGHHRHARRRQGRLRLRPDPRP